MSYKLILLCLFGLLVLAAAVPVEKASDDALESPEQDKELAQASDEQTEDEPQEEADQEDEKQETDQQEDDQQETEQEDDQQEDGQQEDDQQDDDQQDENENEVAESDDAVEENDPRSHRYKTVKYYKWCGPGYHYQKFKRCVRRCRKYGHRMVCRRYCRYYLSQRRLRGGRICLVCTKRCHRYRYGHGYRYHCRQHKCCRRTCRRSRVVKSKIWYRYRCVYRYRWVHRRVYYACRLPRKCHINWRG